MKYVKGDQEYKLDSKEMIKVNLVHDGEIEGIWARQADDHIVLQNASLAFYPLPSWGAVFPSTPDHESEYRKKIDVTSIRGDSPLGTVLELHPEAWDKYIAQNMINEEGQLLDDDGEIVFK